MNEGRPSVAAAFDYDLRVLEEPLLLLEASRDLAKGVSKLSAHIATMQLARGRLLCPTDRHASAHWSVLQALAYSMPS